MAERNLHSLTMPLLVAGTLMLSASGSDAMPAFSSLSFDSSRDTILVQKSLNTKKHKIKLDPDANHRVLFFNVTGIDGKVYQLFIFDIDGKLVKQTNIRNKETTVVNIGGKGNYVYEVFTDDERIENGQVIIR